MYGALGFRVFFFKGLGFRVSIVCFTWGLWSGRKRVVDSMFLYFASAYISDYPWHDNPRSDCFGVQQVEGVVYEHRLDLEPKPLTLNPKTLNTVDGINPALP